MCQHKNQKQLLQMIGEQLARIIELEEALSFAQQRFDDLTTRGTLPRIKR